MEWQKPVHLGEIIRPSPARGPTSTLLSFFVVTKVSKYICILYKLKKTAEKQQYYIPFPYFDCKSEKFKSELLVIFSKYFPQIKLNVVLTNSFKIGCMFHYKGVSPKSVHSSVIHNYRCECCLVS